MHSVETIDVKQMDDRLLQLTNNIQVELMHESGISLEGSDKEILEWIMANAAKFRIEFERLWQEIANDSDYAEIMSWFNNNDLGAVKQALLPLIRERMK